MVNIDLKLQPVNPFYFRIARPALISNLIQRGRFFLLWNYLRWLTKSNPQNKSILTLGNEPNFNSFDLF